MTLHTLGAHSAHVNGHFTWEQLQSLQRNEHAQVAKRQSRGTAEPHNNEEQFGLPSGHSTDGETVGKKTMGKWQRSHKGLDPASAAILGYLGEVATQGVATVKQITIASRTGLRAVPRQFGS